MLLIVVFVIEAGHEIVLMSSNPFSRLVEINRLVARSYSILGSGIRHDVDAGGSRRNRCRNILLVRSAIRLDFIGCHRLDIQIFGKSQEITIFVKAQQLHICCACNTFGCEVSYSALYF